MTLLLAIVAHQTTQPPMQVKEKSVYEFKLKDIDGKPLELDKFQGKVLLIVNVASRCGQTPQYQGLQGLFEKYKSDGLVILGFPANDFKGQEPGTNAEIKEFCSTKYGVTFPMAEKISVLGDTIHPLYKWLIETAPTQEPVDWNFHKFLVGRNGKVIRRFSAKTQPSDETLIGAIEAALEEK